jgi:hypothetical protein
MVSYFASEELGFPIPAMTAILAIDKIKVHAQSRQSS